MVARIRNRSIAKVFDRWGEFVFDVQARRRRVEKLVSKWQSGLLRRGVNQWRLAARELRQAEVDTRIRQQRMKAVAVRLKQRGLSRAFGTWVSHWHQQRLLRRFASRMWKRAKAAAFGGWLDFVEARLYQRNLTARLLFRWSHKQQRVGMVTWKHATLMSRQEEMLRRHQAQRMRGVIARFKGEACPRPGKLGANW